jgi:hypothetical protein
MAWESWQGRVDQLPQILTGPILRQVKPGSVTVWLALRAAATVTLRVFASNPNDAALIGTRSTIEIANSVHVVAVTAIGATLTEGSVYQYNVYLGSGAGPVPVSGSNLTTTGILSKGAIGPSSLGCGGLPLPSFALPPADLNKLRIMHGSCRKPHGGGDDALRELATVIDDSATQPLDRPHLLFLTGDQIYADDVADALLLMLIDAGAALGFVPEAMPEVEGGVAPPPGERISVLKDAGISADRGLVKASSAMKSHLMTLSEYSLMYVMAWSDVLWQGDLPTYQQVYGRDPPRVGREQHEDKECFDRQEESLLPFKDALVSARRALANVPTYMIFDDHEITDDWYLDRKWVDESVASSLFHRVVQNGLIGYALFQAWGNDPDQFQSGQRGGQLLNAIVSWAQSPNSDPDAGEVRARLGMPTDSVPTGESEYPRSTDAVTWHYELSGTSYRIIVIDPRTRRAYLGGHDYPALLSVATLDEQLKTLETTPLNDEQVLIVVSPAPVVGNPTLEMLQGVVAHLHPYFLDPEFWAGNAGAFQRFLTRIATSAGNANRQRVVLLSGDVHYGFSARVRFSAQTPFEQTSAAPAQGVLAQFTCSAFKNEGFPGTALHEDGRLTLFEDGLPEVISYCWNNPSQDRRTIGTIGSGTEASDVIRSSHPIVYEKRSDFALASTPDWQVKLKFVRSEQDPLPTPPPEPVPPPPPDDRNQELKAILKTGMNHLNYKTRFSSGMNAVGRNNLGEITFSWGVGEEKFAIQRLFWTRGEEETATPLGRFRVPLSLQTESF